MRATHVIALLLAIGGTASAQDGVKTWDFQSDKIDEAPPGFSFGKTGQGRPGKWVVRADPSARAGDHVLAQVDTDDTDYRFPVAVADAPVVKDLRLEARCKQISGKTDQACGLVFRYQDEGNYYVARANALEDNVRLYRVVEGKRRQLAGWNGRTSRRTGDRRDPLPCCRCERPEAPAHTDARAAPGGALDHPVEGLPRGDRDALRGLRRVPPGHLP